VLEAGGKFARLGRLGAKVEEIWARKFHPNGQNGNPETAPKRRKKRAQNGPTLRPTLSGPNLGPHDLSFGGRPLVARPR